MAHRREDAPTKRPVVGRMRHPQGLCHVALGQPMLARVIGHPADAEREFGGGAEQRPSQRVAIPATEQRRDLSTQVLDGHREHHSAAMPVVDGLQAGLHGPDRFDIRITNTARSSVPLHPPVRRTDQPSQGDLASHGRSSHGDQELTSIQPAPPQLDQHLHGALKVIRPPEADLCLLQAHHAAAGGTVIDEVLPRDAGDALDADGVVAADPAFAGFPFADVAAADAKMAASAVSVLPVLDLVGEVVLRPTSGESGGPKFLAPGGNRGHGKDPLAGGLAALYLLPYLMGPISLMAC